jgi:DNA end-binding protein Ku
MTRSASAPAETFLGTASVPGSRPSWSGLLQFSLVNVPVKAFPAVRSREVSHFHQLHADCGQRIRYAKHCPVHGPVDSAAIVKGYEYGRDQHVVLDPDELDALRPAQDRALRLERFVDPGQCDPVLFSGRSLHLLPDGVAADHAYEVLRESLVRKGRWAIGRLVLSGQRQVALLRPAGTLLLLHVLHYPEAVRAAARPTNGRSGVSSAELQLAAQLIDAASGAVDWSAYPDQTTEELRALVEAKIQGQAPCPAEPAAVVLPLLKALEQSVADLDAAAEATGRSKERSPRKRSKRTA